MNKETIEKAAMEYADNATPSYINGDFDRYAIADSFEAGAEWRINSVWHDVREKPDKNKLVLFEFRKTYGKGYSVNFGENYALMNNVILGWAYVKDLLPERTEATHD